jgi:hypothetical protein
VSLRLQLLAVALLTLVLPWTGFHYVQEMETALRAELEQSLLARAAGLRSASSRRHRLCDRALSRARARWRS